MNKFKTAEIGQALKKVFKNTMTINESVLVAKKEINNVFTYQDTKIEESKNTGFYFDKIGQCPLCGNDVVKGKFNYGCLGYKNGCKFKISFKICKRTISIDNAKLLLETGVTSKIKGFVSKNNKLFDAKLKLDNGNIIFDFNN